MQNNIQKNRHFRLCIIRCVAALTTLIWAASPQIAEVIRLKNGQVLLGKVVNQDRANIQVRTDEGVLRTIPKRLIRSTSYNSEDERQVREQMQREKEKIEAQRQEAERREAERQKAESEKEAQKANSNQENTTNTDSPPSTAGIVLRSAILPGWGHLAMNADLTGGAYMALNALAIGYAVQARQGALQAQTQNNQDVTLNYGLSFAPDGLNLDQRLAANYLLNTAAKSGYESAVNNFNQSLQIFGGVYVIQLVHAYIAASLRPESAQASPSGNGWAFVAGIVAPASGNGSVWARDSRQVAEMQAVLQYHWHW
ncbi:MAG: hypothetical protein KDK39_06795 [Leptospiraceae bacterium]|nr:hypothetical protein [Leptospiraceae bacterium]